MPSVTRTPPAIFTPVEHYSSQLMAGALETKEPRRQNFLPRRRIESTCSAVSRLALSIPLWVRVCVGRVTRSIQRRVLSTRTRRQRPARVRFSARARARARNCPLRPHVQCPGGGVPGHGISGHWHGRVAYGTLRRPLVFPNQARRIHSLSRAPMIEAAPQ